MLKYDKGNYKDRTILSSGQTACIEFSITDAFGNFPYDYYCTFAIADKKKHINAWLENRRNPLTGVSTGKCGLEGLAWAWERVLEMETLLAEKHMACRIIIQGEDAKRMRVYRKHCCRYGYREAAHPRSGRFLFKIIPANN